MPWVGLCVVVIFPGHSDLLLVVFKSKFCEIVACFLCHLADEKVCLCSYILFSRRLGWL